MSLAVNLHRWLRYVDPHDDVDWYEHLVLRSFTCGCQPWETYCPEWQAVINPPSPVSVNSFWIHTNSTPVSDALLRLEIPRRRYVVLNAWEYGLVPKIKAINPACTVLVYKDISSVRSYDSNPDVRMLPAGVAYTQAKVQAAWQALSASTGIWLQYQNYAGHHQMDVGTYGYQVAWAMTVARMAELGFDGVWMDNALWKRDTYHPGVPVRGYATDEAFREAYRSFFRNVCPKLKAAGLISVANMVNARLVSGGWASYLDAGLDGGFDEWWISVDNSGNNLLPEYTEGWRRQVHQITYAEAKGKIALVQPHFPAGNIKAFRYTYASYLMGLGGAGLAAYTEANGTDQYGNPTPWRAEYEWDLGAPLDGYVEVRTNVFTRHFTRGVAVVNANKTDTMMATIPLGGEYLNEAGARVTNVSVTGTTGRILRRA